jgi:hypothetical protein
MRKAQITIFIVLGIVILIVFSLVFFIYRQTSVSSMEKRANKIYRDFLSSTDIKYITENCLDKTTKQALLLVGLQGGKLYNYQINKGYQIKNFYDVIPFNYNGIIYNVSYGIKAPINLPFSLPPNYPYLGALVENPVLAFDSTYKYSQSRYAHLFSFQNTSKSVEKRPLLPPLCNRLGANYYGIRGAKRSCETYSSTNQSVQEYITRYIDQNIKNCINFTSQTTPTHIISAGTPFSTVLIGENDLSISLKYPLEISLKGESSTTKYLDSNVRLKIRLKILHEIASHLIGKYPRNYPAADADNIFFDITKDDPNDCYKGKGPCILDGISVSKLRDYCLVYNCNFYNNHYKYSDILIIEDSKSIINGKPYRFQFAIENRRPALDLINNINSPSTEVDISTLGIDPDEDTLTYNFEVGAISKTTSQGNTTITLPIGTQNLRVTVSDNEGLQDYQDVQVRVS